MNATELTYAVSGTPNFLVVSAGLEHADLSYENLNSILLAVVKEEAAILGAEKKEEQETCNTYFLPSNDSQAKEAISLILKFANETGEDTESRTFIADVLTAMYFRNYEVLIKNLKEESNDE